MFICIQLTASTLFRTYVASFCIVFDISGYSSQPPFRYQIMSLQVPVRVSMLYRENDSTQHSVAGGEYMRSNICDFLHTFLESHVTSSSSRLTFLLYLPQRVRMSIVPTFTALANNKHGFGRNLDASTPVPYSSMSDPDSRVLGHDIWGNTQL